MCNLLKKELSHFMIKAIVNILSVILLSLPIAGFGLTFPLPSKSTDIVGHLDIMTVHEFTVPQIMANYDVGYFELIEANPGVNLEHLSHNQQLLIPTEFILPNTDRKGLVINLAEMRLYFYPANTHKVITFPVGIGKDGWETPIMKSKVTAKAKNPSWRATKAVRQDFLKRYGYPLPEIVPPGPQNPLGHYAYHLGYKSYYMHGTNDPSGIGKRSSAGCLRMEDEDAGSIFDLVRKGTPVNIVYQTCKAGWANHQVYLEAHLPLSGDTWKTHYSCKQEVKIALKQHPERHVTIDWKKVDRVAKQGLGVPQLISKTS